MVAEEDQTARLESLCRDHKKKVEKLSNELHTARRSLEEREKELARSLDAAKQGENDVVASPDKREQEMKGPSALPAPATARSLSGLLILGWLSLLAGVGAAVAVPFVSSVATAAISVALVIGVIVLLWRRTPLVLGLVALSISMPPMLGWGVSRGFRGLLPPPETINAQPKALPAPPTVPVNPSRSQGPISPSAGFAPGAVDSSPQSAFPRQDFEGP